MNFNNIVVVLAGSTKFENKIKEVEKELIKQGYCVISFTVFKNYEWPKGVIEVMQFKQLLADAHFKKIDLCDELYVVDIDGYIGESTKLEIQHALDKGKVVRYYSKEHEENK